jgi:hypothetical protein
MSTTVGGLNVFATQQSIFDYITDNIPWEVIGGELPDAENIQLVNGVLKPYVVVRFSDSLKASGQASMGGPRQDGYYSLVQTLSVAAKDSDARELSSNLNMLLLGYTPDVNAGPLEKDFGGGAFSIKAVNSRPTAFVSIAAYRFLTNMQTTN